MMETSQHVALAQELDQAERWVESDPRDRRPVEARAACLLERCRENPGAGVARFGVAGASSLYGSAQWSPCHR